MTSTHQGLLAAGLTGLEIDLGLAPDLTATVENGKLWDFNEEYMMGRAKKILEKEILELLMGSPMHTMHWNWQLMNQHWNP